MRRVIFSLLSVLIAALLTNLFVSRLRYHSARAWEALREDEICQALGINTTNVKLSAFIHRRPFTRRLRVFSSPRDRGFISPKIMDLLPGRRSSSPSSSSAAWATSSAIVLTRWSLVLLPRIGRDFAEIPHADLRAGDDPGHGLAPGGSLPPHANRRFESPRCRNGRPHWLNLGDSASNNADGNSRGHETDHALRRPRRHRRPLVLRARPRRSPRSSAPMVPGKDDCSTASPASTNDRRQRPPAPPQRGGIAFWKPCPATSSPATLDRAHLPEHPPVSEMTVLENLIVAQHNVLTQRASIFSLAGLFGAPADAGAKRAVERDDLAGAPLAAACRRHRGR